MPKQAPQKDRKERAKDNMMAHMACLNQNVSTISDLPSPTQPVQDAIRAVEQKMPPDVYYYFDFSTFMNNDVPTINLLTDQQGSNICNVEEKLV